MQKNKKETSLGRQVQKEMIGTVVSDKPDKTVIVKVSHLTVHPVFKKTLRKYNKFKAHDEKNKAKTGDTVKIREARPISKNKCWRLVEIVKKAE